MDAQVITSSFPAYVFCVMPLSTRVCFPALTLLIPQRGPVAGGTFVSSPPGGDVTTGIRWPPAGPSARCAPPHTPGNGAACSPNSTSSSDCHRGQGRERQERAWLVTPACLAVPEPQGAAPEPPLPCSPAQRQRKLLASPPKSKLVRGSPERVSEFSCQN